MTDSISDSVAIADYVHLTNIYIIIIIIIIKYYGRMDNKHGASLMSVLSTQVARLPDVVNIEEEQVKYQWQCEQATSANIIVTHIYLNIFNALNRLSLAVSLYHHHHHHH